MREIVLDTETTGLSPANGDRMVEIGCVELTNHLPTGEEFHTYINPERDVPTPAFEVHGLSEEFLAGHPVFSAAAEDFLAFIRNDPLIIHNAAFDLGFLNAELTACRRPEIPESRAIDTLILARRKFPGAPASLDALCRRLEIDLSAREKHGALLDCHLLAGVYLELIGGRQQGLGLRSGGVVGAGRKKQAPLAGDENEPGARPSSARPPRPHAPGAEELEAHRKMRELLDNPLWNQ
jgi:DNA polymerase-3 subunit epsilon